MNLQITLENILTEEFSRRDINDEPIYLVPEGAFTLGTCNTEEFSKKSDIDIQLVYKDININNPKIKKTLEILTNRLQQEIGREVNIWANPESTYNNDNQFESTPTNDYFELDGWDNICSKYLKKLIKDTGRTVFGKNYLENIKISKFTKQDAHELFLVSTVDFGKNNVYKRAKGILRTFAANHMLKTGEALTQYKEIAEAAKGTQYESLIWEAYVTKVYSHRSLWDKTKFLLKNKEWPKPKFNQENAIHLMLETKSLTMPEVQSLQEEAYQTRISLKLVEKLFEFKDVLESEMHAIFAQELINYMQLTDKEDKLIMPYQKRDKNIINKIVYTLANAFKNPIHKKYDTLEQIALKNRIISWPAILLEKEDLEILDSQVNKPFVEEAYIKHLFARSAQSKEFKKKVYDFVKPKYKKNPHNQLYLKVLSKTSKKPIKYLKKIIKQDPQNIDAYCQLITIKNNENLLVEARKISPDNPFLDYVELSLKTRTEYSHDELQKINELTKKIYIKFNEYPDTIASGGINIDELKAISISQNILAQECYLQSQVGVIKVQADVNHIYDLINQLEKIKQETIELKIEIKGDINQNHIRSYNSNLDFVIAKAYTLMARKAAELGAIEETRQLLMHADYLITQIPGGLEKEIKEQQTMFYGILTQAHIEHGSVDIALEYLKDYESELEINKENINPINFQNRLNDCLIYKIIIYDKLKDKRAKIYAKQLLEKYKEPTDEQLKQINIIINSNY